MHRDSGPATVSSAAAASGVLGSGISNVANVDLHSDLSLEHGGCCGSTSLVVESEGQWRKHTMLKIGNLEQEEAIVTLLLYHRERRRLSCRAPAAVVFILMHCLKFTLLLGTVEQLPYFIVKCL